MSDLYVARGFGLGDVLMLCGAAKAFVAHGHTVHVGTDPAFIPLVKLCPSVADVNAHYPGNYNRMDDATHGISGIHQVDSYLRAWGIYEPDPELKRIELRQDISSATTIEHFLAGPRIAVVHPALTDPNRTWPLEHWNHLVVLLKEAGYTVVQIGRDGSGKGVHRLEGVIQTTNRLDLLETLEMIRASEVFISTDSGPVQLAGATRTHMVIIYSSVAGSHRIPYGADATIIQAPCRMECCYRYMHEPTIWAQHVKPDLNDTFRLWCPAKDNFACLGRVTPEMVMSAV